MNYEKIIDQLHGVVNYLKSGLSFTKTPKTDQKLIADLEDMIFEIEKEQAASEVPHVG